MPRRLSREGGFTLVESLLGLFLMSTALLTLMAMFTVSGRTVLAGRQRTSATYLAQVMIDRLTNESLVKVGLYDKVDTQNEDTYPVDDMGGDGTVARAVVSNWAALLQSELHEEARGTVSVGPLQTGTKVVPPASEGEPPTTEPVYAEGLISIAVKVTWPIGKSRTSSVKLSLVRRL